MFSTYLRQKKASKSHPVKMNRCQFVTIKKHPLSDYLTGFIDCSNKPLTDAVYE